MSLDVDCDVCRLRLQPPARVLTATALLVAAVAVARVTTLCGFVVVGDGCVGCHHLNLSKHPIKAVRSQVAFLGTGADGNAWVCCVGCWALVGLYSRTLYLTLLIVVSF